MRNEPGDRHGWTSLQNYLNVHHRYLDDLREHFILDDDLQYLFPREGLFKIAGRIHCRNGLFIDVNKHLRVNRWDQVRTARYRYHAGIEGRQDRPIFRYDNAHAYSREGHADEHHKHRFDPTTWQEIKPPEWIGRARWPHLSEVVEELEAWWRTAGQHLDLIAAP
ncbi:MAG: toxin-antitoxin system TumE family protein [Thermomicrobiales bacterium]